MQRLPFWRLAAEIFFMSLRRVAFDIVLQLPRFMTWRLAASIYMPGSDLAACRRMQRLTFWRLAADIFFMSPRRVAFDIVL